jgi:hypothetical protein
LSPAFATVALLGARLSRILRAFLAGVLTGVLTTLLASVLASFLASFLSPGTLANVLTTFLAGVLASFLSSGTLAGVLPPILTGTKFLPPILTCFKPIPTPVLTGFTPVLSALLPKFAPVLPRFAAQLAPDDTPRDTPDGPVPVAALVDHDTRYEGHTRRRRNNGRAANTVQVAAAGKSIEPCPAHLAPAAVTRDQIHAGPTRQDVDDGIAGSRAGANVQVGFDDCRNRGRRPARGEKKHSASESTFYALHNLVSLFFLRRPAISLGLTPSRDRCCP